MTIAEKIRMKRECDFDTEFDIAQFGEYLEKYFSKYHSLTIGICSDSSFNSYLHQKRQSFTRKHLEFLTPKRFCKWIAYAESYECYVWSTNIQIPQKFVNNIINYLKEQGFRCSQKGACGYSTYDVIEVTL